MFDSRPVCYGLGELDMLVLAYAATIHKSQGSEYPAIVIPIMTQHYAMLQRNLLYTGVTRGKGLVELVGQRKSAKPLQLRCGVLVVDVISRVRAPQGQIETEHGFPPHFGIQAKLTAWQPQAFVSVLVATKFWSRSNQLCRADLVTFYPDDLIPFTVQILAPQLRLP